MPLNIPQQLFLDQARSDYEIYELLNHRNVCHRLHYLQMATEKLSKAWFWRLMQEPRGHYTFEQFLRALDGRADFHQMFGYSDVRKFDRQWPLIRSLATRIQNLVPTKNDPNSEYPWPSHLPANSPLTYPFPEWQDWRTTTAGRRLRIFVETLLRDYLVYFP